MMAGQLYRADILGLKAFRVSPVIQRLCSRFLVPLLGSTKPPRRSNRAMPDESSASSTSILRRRDATDGMRERTGAGRDGSRARLTEDGRADTASLERSDNAQADGANPFDVDTSASANAGTGTSLPGRAVVREWVDELTGRAAQAESGLRVPSDSEIDAVTAMFPDFRREDIVGALQRRYGVLCFLFLATN